MRLSGSGTAYKIHDLYALELGKYTENVLCVSVSLTILVSRIVDIGERELFQKKKTDSLEHFITGKRTQTSTYNKCGSHSIVVKKNTVPNALCH